MRVLVTGALGFIGRQIVARLLVHGHEVVAAVRPQRRGELPDAVVAVDCDLARELYPAIWLPRLGGVEAIVNAACLLMVDGALLDALQRQSPLPLVRAGPDAALG